MTTAISPATPINQSGANAAPARADAGANVAQSRRRRGDAGDVHRERGVAGSLNRISPSTAPMNGASEK